MMNFIFKHKLTLMGIAAGAIGGYLYYHYIGCAGGTCMITSKPVNSTLYGSLLGGLLANVFQNNSTKK